MTGDTTNLPADTTRSAACLRGLDSRATDARGAQPRTNGPFGDTSVDTPVGPLRIIASPRGIVEIVFSQDTPARASALRASETERLAPVAAPDELGPDVGSAIRAHLELAATQLMQYFACERRDFTVPLDFTLSSGFYLDVRKAMVDIPYGEVATYGDLAAMAGRPRAARAAGTACARNPIPIIVPCHRVIPASGGSGAYSGGWWIKEWLQALESRPRRT